MQPDQSDAHPSSIQNPKTCPGKAAGDDRSKIQNPAAGGSSYGQILKSSSIIGGAQGINYLIGMVRTKLVAVLLGPSGVGLVGLYQSATGLVGTIAGLGIGSSGVREVAEAYSQNDPNQIAQTVKTLRRACWVTGIFGWALTAALSYYLSLWTFGSGERAGAIALLGGTLLFGSISGGQTALLQGVRRIADIARINVASAICGTLVAVGFYAWLGERGIVPALITTAAFNLAVAWWFARRVEVIHVAQSFATNWRISKRLVGFGLAFMLSCLFTAVFALAIRGLIVRELGMEANGIYQAAWGISGLFAGFILGAMGTDFYPRLTAVAHDNVKINQLVNEQTEVGILLALPGLIATLSFAPWMMRIFYTAKFIPGADMLPWFILGVFGRVVSWPMGFILFAKGASRWFIATEFTFGLLHLGLCMILLRWFGLSGIALASAGLYAVYTLGMLWISAHLCNLYWTRAVLRLLSIASCLVAAGFCAQRWTTGQTELAIGVVLSTLSCLFSLRGIAARLGSQHRLVRLACRIPGGKTACGVPNDANDFC